MLPLYIAHLIGDFLLQPAWLVNLKMRRSVGVIIHAIIHAIVMGILVMPERSGAFLTIGLIALLHGVIDQIKISYSISFLLDQLAHFGIITATLLLPSFLYPTSPAFWKTENGITVLLLLAFFSVGMGMWNLTQKSSRKMLRIILMLITAAFFILPAKLLASSACFGL